MFVPQRDLNVLQSTTEISRRGEESKYHRMATEEERAGAETALTVNGKILMEVSSFKYLGRVMSDSDRNCPYLVSNLRKTQDKWVCL